MGGGLPEWAAPYHFGAGNRHAKPVKPMILVTAFEPFGFVRGRLLRRNASLEVMARLQARLGEDDVRFMRLEVGNAGIARLKAALAEFKPAALLAMGESGRLPGDRVVLEPFADHCQLVPDDDPSGPDRLFSPFAASLGARPEDSGIGAYYCNAAYWAGLRWAETQAETPPVAFIHVPVAGDRATHARQVMDIFSAMRRATSYCPDPEPMLTAGTMQAPPEIIRVHARRVACDGSGDGIPAALGHPRVFLEIDEHGYVDCGYCDRRYVLEGGVADKPGLKKKPDIASGASL